MSSITSPPLDFIHQSGFEILTKHKEAIRQLHWYGKVLKIQLQECYQLGDTIINKILRLPCSRACAPKSKGQALTSNGP